MFIYNDVKISICICGDTAGDLPQYVLLTMEGIGLHVPVVHVFRVRTVCLGLCFVAAQGPPERGKSVLGRARKDEAYTIYQTHKDYAV